VSKRLKIISALLLLLVMSCGGPRDKKAVPSTRPFPKVTVPEAYIDQQDRVEYTCSHYWDGYLAGTGQTDSAFVLGVERGELEQALSNYIAILGMAPLKDAQKCMAKFFEGVCEVQKRDTLSQFYTQFTQMVADYLYNPNSPMRDEDLYLPFVQGLAESPLTREDMRPAYRYEAMVCALNQRGTIAPDFSARKMDGSVFTLHGISAPYTLLFFSNPGCGSCKEIISQINSQFGEMVDNGGLAVVNIYIDDQINDWYEYIQHYPEKWYNGYDYKFVIRNEVLYDVRAIPSLYLLDAEKRILAKDAPLEKIIVLLSRQGANE
jgi:thiol-disulfide isomerase/thioredoxin